jgi:transposase-like protein
LSFVVSCSLGVRGLWFPAEVIVAAMRWYLRYGRSYRDVGGLLADEVLAPIT